VLAAIRVQGEFDALSVEFVALRQRFEQMHAKRPVSLSEHRRFSEDAADIRGRLHDFPGAATGSPLVVAAAEDCRGHTAEP
jgi:hypothetical protein